MGEFDKDMNEITSYTLEFFNDYTATTGSELAMELEKFVTMLERRILREETFLLQNLRSYMNKKSVAY